jgi:hypothetical protein
MAYLAIPNLQWARRHLMILGIEIALLVVGILVVLWGRIPLSGGRAVEGAGARIVGIILMMPIPVSFGLGFFLGASGRIQLNYVSLTRLAVFEATIVGSFVLLAVAVAYLLADVSNTDDVINFVQPPPRDEPSDESRGWGQMSSKGVEVARGVENIQVKAEQVTRQPPVLTTMSQPAARLAARRSDAKPIPTTGRRGVNWSGILRSFFVGLMVLGAFLALLGIIAMFVLERFGPRMSIAVVRPMPYLLLGGGLLLILVAVGILTLIGREDKND